jgi:cytochrome c-type biogenesis protein CcmH/NrfG
MVTLLALAVGFFGGVVFTVFKSDSKAPVPSAPAQMGTPAPAPAGSDRIAALERQTQAEPGNVTAWTELGNAYFDSNQYEASISAYRKSLELDPGNPNVWTDMGVMYRRAGKPEEAIKAFDQAIAADPKHEVSRMRCHSSLGGAARSQPDCHGAQWRLYRSDGHPAQKAAGGARTAITIA